MAVEAWHGLSTAYAKLSIRDREREAYNQVLDLDPRPFFRGIVYYNRGDLELEAGDLDAAIADYRRAIPLMFGPLEPSLAYWSLGLALERNGDLPSALDAVAMAQTIYAGPHFLTALDDPRAFFVPPYEKSYLAALGELACARDAPTAELAIRSYEDARTYFEDYILRALPDKHRGLSNAKLELRMIERKLRALETAPARAPKSDVGTAIRPGCPRPEVPVPPPPHLPMP
jgi:tetratricopeptide (TPR) repeat protein